jgi:acyl carrier protein
MVQSEEASPSGDSVADPNDVRLAIRAFLTEDFLLADDEFDDDTSLIGSGIIDSTGAMEVVAYLEETFGIEVADEDLVADNLDSVARLTRYVSTKRSQPDG